MAQLILCFLLTTIIYYLTGEQAFHEALTPSLTWNVEHVTNFTDLPKFKTSDDVVTQFTDDILIMDELCSDILSEVNTSHSDALIVGLSIQLTPTSTGPKIKAIQLHTATHNLVFNVIIFLNLNFLYLNFC